MAFQRESEIILNVAHQPYTIGVVTEYSLIFELESIHRFCRLGAF